MVKGRTLAVGAGAALAALSAARAEAALLAAPALDEKTRFRLYMALLAIVLLAMLLWVIIRLGAWSFKRKVRQHRGPSRMGPKNWAAMRFLRPRAPVTYEYLPDEEDRPDDSDDDLRDTRETHDDE